MLSFKEFILESSYRDLESKTLSFNPSSVRRQHAVDPIRVDQLNIVPYLGTKTLMFRALVNSDSGKKYDVTITFDNIKFGVDEVLFTATNGKEYSIEKIGKNTNNVRVRCQCADFYYRFAWYNADDKSLHGPKPKPYVRKTTTRPPVNPDHTPGFCKHILKVFGAIDHAGFFEH